MKNIGHRKSYSNEMTQLPFSLAAVFLGTFWSAKQGFQDY